MVLMNLAENGLVDTAEEGEDVVNWESGIDIYTLSSVQFSRSVMFYSLWPHEPQHARPPCPSPTPRVHVHYHVWER